jgi:HEAT repeat protein
MRQMRARRWLLPGILAAALGASDARALVWPDVPERVERGLGSVDPATRRAAAVELANLSSARATPLLLRALEDPDADVKVAAAEAAIRLRVPSATAAVLGWLGGPDPKLRIEACAVARALPDPRAVTALGRALGDAEAPVRAAAADSLGAYAGNADAAPPLLGKLDDASPVVRAVIVRSLARLGDERAVVPLVGKAQDSVPEVRQAVARALGDLGDARATQALLLQLRDNVIDVRIEALGALGKLHAADAAFAVAPLVSDRTATLRQAAIAALGRIGSPPAVHALVLALGTGDDGVAGLERTPVREALVAAGPAAVAEVASVLDHPASPAAAASAAWILGELHARDRAPALVAAMRRGVVPDAAALHALAGAGTSDSLRVVLEFTSDPRPDVRDQALAAAAALLDPTAPDGRAAEPLAAALRDPNLAPAERAKIARLLGLTGAARAAADLAGLARSKGVVVRLASIDALGTLGPVAATRAEDLAPLVDALADPDPTVRLHASVALGETGDARTRDALVAKLDTDEIDHASVLGALGGVLSRAPDGKVVARLVRELEIAAGPSRDAIIEAVGRTHTPSVMDVLARLAEGVDVDDARAAATLLSAHGDEPAEATRARAIARTLLSHSDATVRAQAAFALGTLDDGGAVRALVPLLHASTPEAIDAATALGRIAARTKDPAIASALCDAADSPHSYVRASAFAGLEVAHARCEDGVPERRALEADPSDAVRGAAARVIAASPRGDVDSRALARCAAEDRAGSVAALCRAPSTAPLSRTSQRTHAVEVYVIPDLAAGPLANAPYVLVLEGGALHAGTSDRRGAVFDPVAPQGVLTLLRGTEK